MLIALFALSAISFMVGSIVFFYGTDPEYAVGHRKFVRWCFIVGTSLALLIPVVSFLTR